MQNNIFYEVDEIVVVTVYHRLTALQD